MDRKTAQRRVRWHPLRHTQTVCPSCRLLCIRTSRQCTGTWEVHRNARIRPCLLSTASQSPLFSHPKTWSVKVPKVHSSSLWTELPHIPFHSTSLNLIERVWRYVKSELGTRELDDFDEFKDGIDGLVASTSATPWTASGRSWAREPSSSTRTSNSSMAPTRCRAGGRARLSCEPTPTATASQRKRRPTSHGADSPWVGPTDRLPRDRIPKVTKEGARSPCAGRLATSGSELPRIKGHPSKQVGKNVLMFQRKRNLTQYAT